MASLKVAKKELRHSIKAVLKNLSSEDISQQTSRALGSLFALPEWKAAKRVSVYLSMPSGEIATISIVNNALANGKRVFVPYIYKRVTPVANQPQSIMDMLELRSQQDFESFKPDRWGIPTIPEESVASRTSALGGSGRSEGLSNPQNGKDCGLELIVMPGMAFDNTFGRLGHGKGFYDFFLQRCHELGGSGSVTGMPFLVGLALKEQLLPPAERVPMDVDDWHLDALVVGDGTVLRKQSS